MTGKVAIVTGNGRGLGEAIRAKLLSAGAIVPKCTRRTLDVTSTPSIATYVAFIAETLGHIDILVNNAGILGPVDAIENVISDDVVRALNTNLVGPLTLMSCVIPHMKAAKSGKIINIVGGSEPLPRRSVYAASKAALIRAMESVAAEVAGWHIDVNAVLPGPLPTRMHAEIIEAGPKRLGTGEFNAHVNRDFHGNELALAADLVAWLASPDSDGMTGRTISARHDPWPFDKKAIAEIMASDRYTLRRVNAPSS